MNLLKRAGAGLLAILITASFILVLLPQPKAQAAGIDELCIPPSKSVSGGNRRPTGWLRVEFINRALIKVEMVPSGNCHIPATFDMKYIANSTLFAPLISGNYVDSNTGDGTWDYRRDAGGNDKEDSRIDNFSVQNVGDDFDGNDSILTTNQIRAFRLPSELTIGIEEDEIPNISCDDGENENFVLAVNDNKLGWDCTGDSLGDEKGLRISTAYVGKLENYNITYNYEPESNQIVHVSEGERDTRTFSFCPGENNGDGAYRSENCNGDLVINTTADNLNALDDGNGVFTISKKNSSQTEKVMVAGPTSLSSDETQQGAGPSSDDPNAETDLQCDTLGSVLTWIICPVVKAARELIDHLDNFIIAELNVSEDKYFDEGTSEGATFYGVWSNFRNIGLSILVLVAVVMVLAQALSISVFDAYTVKKVLPRILVAIIFMTLSWDVMKFLLALTNDIGAGVRTMIQSPFSGIPDPEIFGGTANIGSGILVYAGMSLGIFGLLSFAASALMGVIVAFAVLTIRKMVIILLVLLAPFAVAAYILPNTQKFFNLWWSTLSKALMMFPIIMAFIGVGRVFAKIAGVDNGLLDQVVMIIGYYAPYFLMPMAFKMAGGAIATISGMVNDRSRGAFDRVKKFRQGKAEDRIGKFRSGGLYNTDKWRGRAGNKLGTLMFNPDEKIPHFLGEDTKFSRALGMKNGVGLFRGAHTRLDAEVREEQAKQTREFAQRINEVGGNDQTGRVISGAIGSLKGKDGQGRAIQQLLMDRFGEVGADGKLVMGALKTEKDWDDAADIMAMSDKEPERHASGALRALKGEALNLNRKGKGYTNLAAAGGLIVSSHGFMSEKDLVDVGRRVEADTGNAAFADTMMTQMEVNGKTSGLKVTYSHSRDEAGNIITGTEAGRDWDRALSKNYQEIAGQKSHAVTSDVESLSEIIELSKVPEADQAMVAQTIAEQYVKSGMSQKRATKLANQKVYDTGLKDKAAAARKTLEQITLYTPGSGDGYIIARNALEKAFPGSTTSQNAPLNPLGTAPPGSPGSNIGGPSSIAGQGVQGTGTVKPPTLNN